MTAVTDGARVYSYNHLLTGDVELYAHEGGLFVLWDAGKRKQVAIDPIGMTPDEIERAIVACNTVLARADPAPVNRHDRRAAAKLN
jgi:hypothetical protein